MRAASTAEDDGDEDVGAGDSSVEIASVTPPPTSGPKPRLPRPTRRAPPRGPAVRRGSPPDAAPTPALGRAPPAPRPHRRATAAEHQHLDATAAPPESSVHPTAAPLRRGWTPEALDGTVTHGGRVLRRARHEGPGLIDPGLHLLRRASFYVVTALDGDDDAGALMGTAVRQISADGDQRRHQVGTSGARY